MTGEKLWKQFLESDENGQPFGRTGRPIAGISRRSFLAALGYSRRGCNVDELPCSGTENHRKPQTAARTDSRVSRTGMRRRAPAAAPVAAPL